MAFPKLHKFKHYTKRQRRNKLVGIAQILSASRTKDEFLQTLENMSERDIKAIERRTREQSKNTDWFYYRQAVITGTLARRISISIKKGQGCNEKINAAISKIESVQLYYPAIRYGRDNESTAIRAFLKSEQSVHTNLKVHSKGLQLDKTMPFIGGSIDGWVTCDCCPEPRVLEVKCPYSLRTSSSISEDGRKLAYLDEKLDLRHNHQYYYQVQTYLGIYNCSKAHFVVWTPNDLLIRDINFDEKLWKNLKEDLRMYYIDSYLK